MEPSLNQNLILPLTCPWQTMELQFGSANVKWCEERICSVINEPINAWSNILYIFIGLFLIYRGYRTKKTSAGQFDFYFGCVTYIMGFLSFAYHATNNYLTQIFDFIGMYAYIYFLLCLSLYILKLAPLKTLKRLFLLLIILSTMLIPIAKYFHFTYQFFIIIVAVFILMFQIKIWNKDRASYPLKNLFFSLIFVISGAFFSYMDVNRIFCNPKNHFIQGHAIWHILTAIGVWFSYLAFKKLYLKSIQVL